MDAGHVLPQEPCKLRQGTQVTECIMYTQTLLKFTQLNSVIWYPVTLQGYPLHQVKYVSVHNVFQAKFA